MSQAVAWLWCLVLTPFLPVWALVCAVHPRLRVDWRARLGLSVPPVQPGAVWLHGSSLGEQAAVQALAAAMEGPLLLTADTDTGAESARRFAAHHPDRAAGGVRPVDHPWTLAPLWAEARPRAVVFVEGAWWPGLAALAMRDEVPVLRASARVRSRWLGLHGWLTGGVRAIAARDEVALAWFRDQGLPAELGGDCKAEAAPPPPPLTWSRPFVVAASTRPGDEARVLDALGELEARPQLLLAPRHLERLDEVRALLSARGLAWAARSGLDEVPQALDVVLLDTTGELAGAFLGASAAVVGGTWDAAIGGHSPLEAARAGVPVLHGPETRSQGRAFVEVGGLCCPDVPALVAGLASPPAVLRPAVGAVARTLAVLGPHLVGEPAPERPPRPWALPLVPVYRLGQALHRAWRSRAPVRLPVPVLAVGSANARGPGKTSTGRFWAQRLARQGHRVGVAVRGYGRTEKGLRGSWEDAGWRALGDEGALYAMDGHEVVACADRVAGARALLTRGCTVVLLDDGLAVRQLVRDRVLAVVDARFPRARGFLPAGELREELDTAELTAVVVHHGPPPSGLPAVPVLRARRVAGPWQPAPPSGPLLALAGLGRGADFRSSLTGDVRWFALADHGVPDVATLREAQGARTLVCTAKDRVRLPEGIEAVWRDLVLEVEGDVSVLDP